MAAWFLAEHTRRPEMPGHLLAFLMAAMFIGLLVMQPDFGQTALVILTFGSMLLIYGISWFSVLGLGALAGTGLVLAYEFVPHVQSRIDRFMSPDKGDTFQVDTAMQAFRNGGLMGTGPGGGEAKLVLPDAHTDFTFAVVGEEFGLIACLLLMSLFAFVVLKILARAKSEPDPFAALALSGLGLIFGFQAAHQHGCEHRTSARQGHDAALHLLWRLLAARHGHRHGPRAGAGAAALRRAVACAAAEPGLRLRC